MKNHNPTFLSTHLLNHNLKNSAMSSEHLMFLTWLFCECWQSCCYYAHRVIHTVMELCWGGFCIGCNAVVRSDKTVLALHEHKGSGQARGQRWRINADQCSFLVSQRAQIFLSSGPLTHCGKLPAPSLKTATVPPADAFRPAPVKNYDKLFFSGHPFYWLICPLPRGKKSFFVGEVWLTFARHLKTIGVTRGIESLPLLARYSHPQLSRVQHIRREIVLLGEMCSMAVQGGG